MFRWTASFKSISFCIFWQLFALWGTTKTWFKLVFVVFLTGFNEWCLHWVIWFRQYLPSSVVCSAFNKICWKLSHIVVAAAGGVLRRVVSHSSCSSAWCQAGSLPAAPYISDHCAWYSMTRNGVSDYILKPVCFVQRVQICPPPWLSRPLLVVLLCCTAFAGWVDTGLNTS